MNDFKPIGEIARNIALEVATKRIRDLEGRLIAYQTAFNQVDDLMEYRGMSKDDFKEIAAELTDKITNRYWESGNDKTS